MMSSWTIKLSANKIFRRDVIIKYFVAKILEVCHRRLQNLSKIILLFFFDTLKIYKNIQIL